jgi:hypothetical protein
MISRCFIIMPFIMNFSLSSSFIFIFIFTKAASMCSWSALSYSYPTKNCVCAPLLMFFSKHNCFKTPCMVLNETLNTLL